MTKARWWVTGMVAMALLASACGGGGAGAQRPEPLITEILPASGGIGGGTPVTIRGVGLANDFTGGKNEVLFGGVPAEAVIVQSDAEITCMAPPNALGMCDVTVAKQHGTAVAANGFEYFPPPELDTVSPNEGTRDGGETITLTGKGFMDGNPGAPIVSFGSTPARFVTVVDDATIEVLTPVSFVEKPVDVSVENRYGKATLVGAFVYKGPLPVVTEVMPDSGTTNGGQAVTVKGDFFTLAGGVLSVRFGQAPAVNVVRVDDQTLTCITPISAVDGLVTVSVTNENGTGELPNGFTYIAPPPSILGVTPETAPENTTVPITITGFGFLNFGAGAPTITLGGQPCTNVVVVSEQQITCRTPSLSEGSYELALTNNRGNATLPDAFAFEWIPQWQTSLGTNLNLYDDSSSQVSFGFTFPFYSSSYSTAYVISNGGITLGGPGSLYNYSGQFDTTYPQISPCAWDLNPGYSGGVYFNAVNSTLCTITYSGVPWYYSTGSITTQVQLRSNGSFAILYQNMSVTGGGMVVGISPSGSPSGGSDTVDWVSEPDVGTGVRASESFSLSNWDLASKGIVFKPDGQGGYTTKIITVN